MSDLCGGVGQVACPHNVGEEPWVSILWQQLNRSIQTPTTTMLTRLSLPASGHCFLCALLLLSTASTLLSSPLLVPSSRSCPLHPRRRLQMVPSAREWKGSREIATGMRLRRCIPRESCSALDLLLDLDELGVGLLCCCIALARKQARHARSKPLCDCSVTMTGH